MTDAALQKAIKIKTPLNRGRALLDEGYAREAAVAFQEAVELETNKKKPPRNPFARGFPGGGYKLDSRHRVALAHACAGDFDQARQALLEASKTDPAITEWIEEGLRAWSAEAGLQTLRGLWHLTEKPADLAGEAEALSLIEGVPDARIWPESWWFVAYVELYRCRLPKAAYAAKARASEVARLTAPEKVEARPERLAEIATAFADSGDLATARAYLDRPFEALGCEARELSVALAILSADRKGARVTTRKSEAGTDEAFRSLIRGKRVAVVAPAASELMQGEEIDGFDVVIRTNFRSHETIAKHAGHIGTRTNVAYYNGNFEPENRSEIVESLRAKPLEFVCLRFDDAEAAEAYSGVANLRISHMSNVYFRMNSYAIPKIIHDLLYFEPSQIKIFNADFFLGKRPHYEGYLSYDIQIVTSFMGHDILRNFRLMKAWHDLGMVDADEALSDILKLDEKEVVARVSQRIEAA